MSTLSYTERLAVVHCTCGIPFAIPENLDRRAHDEGTSICCPLGHKWHYTKTTEQKLKEERAKSARIQARLDQEQASLKAQKAATARFRNKVKRAEHGVCPHCNRSFQNLRRHMESKHHP